ncbi:MAG TPA: hypothetical protein VGH46_03205 [Gaiellaceae bacterium]
MEPAFASVTAITGLEHDDIDNYENSKRLCYIRGPEGIIVELAQRID